MMNIIKQECCCRVIVTSGRYFWLCETCAHTSVSFTMQPPLTAAVGLGTRGAPAHGANTLSITAGSN